MCATVHGYGSKNTGVPLKDGGRRFTATVVNYLQSWLYATIYGQLVLSQNNETNIIDHCVRLSLFLISWQCEYRILSSGTAWWTVRNYSSRWSSKGIVIFVSSQWWQLLITNRDKYRGQWLSLVVYADHHERQLAWARWWIASFGVHGLRLGSLYGCRRRSYCGGACFIWPGIQSVAEIFIRQHPSFRFTCSVSSLTVFGAKLEAKDKTRPAIGSSGPGLVPPLTDSMAGLVGV